MIWWLNGIDFKVCLRLHVFFRSLHSNGSTTFSGMFNRKVVGCGKMVDFGAEISGYGCCCCCCVMSTESGSKTGLAHWNDMKRHIQTHCVLLIKVILLIITSGRRRKSEWMTLERCWVSSHVKWKLQITKHHVDARQLLMLLCVSQKLPKIPCW